MKKLFVIAVLMLVLQNTFAQSDLSEYSYIVIPEKYEFLFEEDQHQLNSMTKFLFNKYGFNAFFPNELPNVRRCDGLWANVEEKPGFIWTTLQLVIRDCYGTVVYRGVEGKSKYKEYRKAYQDALRNSFEGIAAMGVKQKPVESSPDLKQTEVSEDTGVTSKSTTAVPAVASTYGLAYIPDAKFSNYTYQGVNYLLRRTANGYSFYQEVEEAEDGLVLLGRIKQDGDRLEYKAENGVQTEVRFIEGGHLELKTSKGSTTYRYKA
jgi:hypothetical protein